MPTTLCVRNSTANIHHYTLSPCVAVAVLYHHCGFSQFFRRVFCFTFERAIFMGYTRRKNTKKSIMYAAQCTQSTYSTSTHIENVFFPQFSPSFIFFMIQVKHEFHRLALCWLGACCLLILLYTDNCLTNY